MTSRERILATLRFQPTDRLPVDLMEGSVWPELQEYFRAHHALQNGGQVQDHLGTDCRWVGLRYVGPDRDNPPSTDAKRAERMYSGQFLGASLADAQTVADVEKRKWPDPAWLVPGDFRAARERWPEHALVFGHSWMPLFWTACQEFGMEEALVKMHTQPAVFEAFVSRQHDYYMDILSRALEAGRGLCDICWLGDDYAGQTQMMFSPELWRKLIKPYLSQQAALAHRHGLYVFFHSCGNIRSILPDLIDIGINAHLVFQTTADEMDAHSIARDFGGRLAFYGGMDVQHLLSFGTPGDVAETVRNNAQAFEKHGGYIVANSHHGVSTIKGENIEAMCNAARRPPAPGTRPACQPPNQISYQWPVQRHLP